MLASNTNFPSVECMLNVRTYVPRFLLLAVFGRGKGKCRGNCCDRFSSFSWYRTWQWFIIVKQQLWKSATWTWWRWRQRRCKARTKKHQTLKCENKKKVQRCSEAIQLVFILPAFIYQIANIWCLMCLFIYWYWLEELSSHDLCMAEGVYDGIMLRIDCVSSPLRSWYLFSEAQ